MPTSKVKLLAAMVLALAATAGLMVSGQSGPTTTLKNLRSEGGKTLVQADALGHHGAAWLSTDLLTATSTFERDRLNTLVQLQGLTAASDQNTIKELAQTSLKRFGPDPEFLMGFAKLFRQTGHFESSWLLYDALIQQQESQNQTPELDLLTACAEAAVLDGDRSRARRAIRTMRRHYGRSIDVLADALEKQVDGGDPVVFAGQPPARFDQEALAKERAVFNKDQGNTLLTADIAKEVLDSLRNANLPGKAAHEVLVRTDAKPPIIQAYNQGGPVTDLTNNTAKLSMHLAVDTKVWEEMADWMKRERMAQALFFGRRHFPKSTIVLSVHAWRAGEEGTRRYGSTLGSLTVNRLSTQMIYDLKTKPKPDQTKENAVFQELKDFEDRRNDRNR